jgi:hypothetical protein
MKSTVLWHATPCSLVVGPMSDTSGLTEQGASLIRVVRYKFSDVFFYLSSILFEPEDGGRMLLRNISKLLPNYTALQPRTQ